ncbi:hypothetical protein [Mycobacterium sp.]|uniref:hypothetical protein n=1 Tax=Mycobacterium sp. TaxID=1785 RepID=UPI003F9A4B5A
MTDTRVAPKAAWTYLRPAPGFEPIAGAVAVMAAQVDRRCQRPSCGPRWWPSLGPRPVQ